MLHLLAQMMGSQSLKTLTFDEEFLVWYNWFIECKSSPIYWQHHGNKKSDSPYYLNNEKNTNTLSEIL